MIAILLVSIYLSIKPESGLIQQFFFTIAIAQVFNFDLLPIHVCGSLGTLSSIGTQMVPMSLMPQVIKTKDVSGINLPLVMVSLLNFMVWTIYGMLVADPFMTVSQLLGFFFNFVQVLFYLWATSKVNSKETPLAYYTVRKLIAVFRMMDTSSVSTMKWDDESSDHAKAHIKNYKEKIKEIEKKYADEENQMSYEQFMEQKGAINRKLRSLSKSYDVPEDDSLMKASANTTDGSKLDIEATIEIEPH